ncbi:MAG: transglutaminase domain-containing protein [Thermoanaerobaculia bacterium]|nr:transglutaminase domain-containing protein [Thermoanaerobaculia bacterium]
MTRTRRRRPRRGPRRLRTFVHGYLARKNLNSVLATASEVASTRAGDCTEHAVLLAALLRADGIPSRLVTGLIYVDDFVGESKLFGYHMWTQAFLGKRWVDLDATLERRFDAAHIAFTTTSLNDEGSALLEMAKIIPLLGRLEVEIVKAEPAP